MTGCSNCHATAALVCPRGHCLTLTMTGNLMEPDAYNSSQRNLSRSYRRISASVPASRVALCDASVGKRSELVLSQRLGRERQSAGQSPGSAQMSTSQCSLYVQYMTLGMAFQPLSCRKMLESPSHFLSHLRYVLLLTLLRFFMQLAPPCYRSRRPVSGDVKASL